MSFSWSCPLGSLRARVGRGGWVTVYGFIFFSLPADIRYLSFLCDSDDLFCFTNIDSDT